VRDTKNSIIVCIYSFTVLILWYLSPIQAAEWSIEPALGVSATYNDNIRQSLPGEEESDFVTEVSPGIALRAEGSQLRFNLNYTMQNLFYAENNDENTTNHELSTDANAELLRKLLFLDALASYRQVLLSPEGTGGADNITITDNRTDAWTYTVSPYAVREFGNLTAELRYTFEKVSFSESDAEDAAASDTQSVFASLASDPSARRQARVSGNSSGRTQTFKPSDRRYANDFQWSLTYNRDQTDFTDNTEDIFENISLDTSYRFGATTALLAGIGYENNEFEQSDATNQPEGFFWYTGFAWNPIRRTSIEATVGRRFYGTTYSLDIRHDTRTVTSAIQYAEDFTTASGTLLEDQGVSIEQEPDLDSADPLVSVPLPGLSSDVFLRRRLTGDISKKTAKSIFTFGAFGEKREYQRTTEEEQLYGFTFGWDWQFASRTAANLALEWSRQDFEEDDRVDDFWQLGLNVNRRVSERIDAYMDYRHARRDSSNAEDDYRENLIAAGLQVEF